MFGDKEKKNRFKGVVHERIDNVGGMVVVYVDTETEVQYVQAKKAEAGGMTVLVGADGKQLLHERYRAK